MTNQEIFDTVVDHLIKQGKPAMQGSGKDRQCAYRGEEGTKCAVGCLIKDEFYNPLFEGDWAGAPEVVKALAKSEVVPIGGADDTVNLLCDLQSVHDSTYFTNLNNETNVKKMDAWLKRTADANNISYDNRFLTKMSKW